MDIYVMRHGIAEDRAASGRDRDRALTPAGRTQVAVVARALQAAGEVPTRVVSSPYVRARETAEAFMEAVGAPLAGAPVEFFRELAAGANAEALFHPSGPLASSEPRAGRTLLVGHEPDLSALVITLCGGGLSRSFDKAMVVALTPASAEPCPGGPLASCYRVRFVFDPRSQTMARTLAPG